MFAGAGLVQADAHIARPAAGEAAQVDALRFGAGAQGVGCGRAAQVQRERVKRVVVHQRQAQCAQAGCQHGGVTGHTLRNAGQALRAVVDGVHAGHHGRQNLRGADVGGGFFAADVLLAGLQRQPVGRVAVDIDAHAHQPSGHGAFVVFAAGQVSGMRATTTHGHTKALRVADHNVSAHFARGFEQGQRQHIGGQNQRRLLAVDLVGRGLPIGQSAAAGGVLVDGGKVVVLRDCVLPFLAGVDQLDRDVQRRGAGLDHGNGLRVAVASHDAHIAFGFDAAPRQRHGLSRGGGFIEHRGVRHRHAGQVADHGLEVDQRFHAPLADLSLVGRVGGVPGRVFQDVAQDHARRVGAVIALAYAAGAHLVVGGHGLEFSQRCGFGNRRRNLHGRGTADAGRDNAFDQAAPRGLADGAEHVRLISGRQADVAGDKFSRVFQIGPQGFRRGVHQHGVSLFGDGLSARRAAE